MIDLVVPELAESISEASVEEWLVEPGSAVTAGQTLLTIETDKVTLEVPATKDGVLAEILKQAGEDVSSGEILGRIDETATAAPSAPAEAQAASPPGAKVSIKVPELAESIAEASLDEWHKQPGEAVAMGEVIATIETDKVTLEVPAPANGVLEAHSVAAGEDVASGQEIAVLAEGAAPAAASAPSAPAAPAQEGDAQAPSSPAARKAMAEGNLSPAQVSGSGKGGRITKQDAVSAAAGAAVPAPASAQAPSGQEAAAFAGTRGVRREKMTKLRTRVAERLLQSSQQTAMLTTFNEADMSAVISMRKQYRDEFEKRHGVKLGFMSFFVKAVSGALGMHPIINAQIDGGDIVFHDYCDIGIAVGSPRGLVVPVLRNAEGMSMAGIERSIADFGARAGSGALTVEELTGGTFTITNGGVFGSLMSTPIINPPQSAILGVHATKERAVVVDGQVVARPMNYLALSYDHRLIDGRDAVLFLVAVKNFLEDPSRLLLSA